MNPSRASQHESGDGFVTEQVMVALRRIIRAIDIHSRSLVQRFGLTGPQLIVLKRVVASPEISVGDLARRVHLSQATVTGIIDRLERKDLLCRSRSTQDKRKVLIRATDTAREVLAAAPPLLQESFITTFGRLPDWEQTQILCSLQRLVALMEAREIEATPMLATGPIDASPEQTTGVATQREDEP